MTKKKSDKKKAVYRKRKMLIPNIKAIRIEKGVAVRPLRGREDPYKVIFAKMKKGDSFTSPLDFRFKCMTYAKYFKEEHGGDFVSRVEEDGKTFRVWRQ